MTFRRADARFRAELLTVFHLTTESCKRDAAFGAIERYGFDARWHGRMLPQVHSPETLRNSPSVHPFAFATFGFVP
jgi:hypothetical protein